jgi:hypothetical protein
MLDPTKVRKGEFIDEVIPESKLRTVSPALSRRGVEMQLFKRRDTGEIIIKESKFYKTVKENVEEEK